MDFDSIFEKNELDLINIQLKYSVGKNSYLNFNYYLKFTYLWEFKFNSKNSQFETLNL